jgi:hypothetical protein
MHAPQTEQKGVYLTILFHTFQNGESCTMLSKNNFVSIIADQQYAGTLALKGVLGNGGQT